MAAATAVNFNPLMAAAAGARQRPMAVQDESLSKQLQQSAVLQNRAVGSFVSGSKEVSSAVNQNSRILSAASREQVMATKNLNTTFIQQTNKIVDSNSEFVNKMKNENRVMLFEFGKKLMRHSYGFLISLGDQIAKAMKRVFPHGLGAGLLGGLGGLGAALKDIVKLAAFLKVASSAIEGIKGWNNADAIFGKKTNFFEKLASGLGEFVNSITFGLSDKIMRYFFGKDFKPGEANLTTKAIGKLFSKLGLENPSDIWKNVVKGFNTVVTFFQDTGKKLVEGFQSFVKKAGEYLSKPLETLRSISDWFVKQKDSEAWFSNRSSLALGSAALSIVKKGFSKIFIVFNTVISAFRALDTFFDSDKVKKITGQTDEVVTIFDRFAAGIGEYFDSFMGIKYLIGWLAGDTKETKDDTGKIIKVYRTTGERLKKFFDGIIKIGTDIGKFFGDEWDKFSNEKTGGWAYIKEVPGRIWDAIKGIGIKIQNWIEKQITSVTQSIKSLFQDESGDDKGWLKSIKDGYNNVKNWITKQWENLVPTKEQFNKFVSNVGAGNFTEIWKGIKDKFKQAQIWVVDTFWKLLPEKKDFEKVVADVKIGNFTEIWKTIKTKYAEAKTWVVDTFNNLLPSKKDFEKVVSSMSFGASDSELWKTIKTKYAEVKTWVVDTFNNLLPSKKYFEKFTVNFGFGTSDSDILKGIKDTISSVGKSVWDFITTTIPKTIKGWFKGSKAETISESIQMDLAFIDATGGKWEWLKFGLQQAGQYLWDMITIIIPETVKGWFSGSKAEAATNMVAKAANDNTPKDLWKTIKESVITAGKYMWNLVTVTVPTMVQGWFTGSQAQAATATLASASVVTESAGTNTKKVIGNLLQMAGNAVWSLLVNCFPKTIYKIVKQWDANEGLDVSDKIINTISWAVNSGVEWLYDHTIGALVQGIFGDKKAKQPGEKSLIGTIFKGIFKVIGGAVWTLAKKIAGSLVFAITQTIKHIASWIFDSAHKVITLALSAVGITWLATNLKTAKTAVVTLGTSIFAGIGVGFTAIGKYFTKILPSSIVNAITETGGEIRTAIKGLGSSIVKGIGSGITKAGELITKLIPSSTIETSTSSLKAFLGKNPVFLDIKKTFDGIKKSLVYYGKIVGLFNFGGRQNFLSGSEWGKAMSARKAFKAFLQDNKIIRGFKTFTGWISSTIKPLVDFVKEIGPFLEKNKATVATIKSMVKPFTLFIWHTFHTVTWLTGLVLESGKYVSKLGDFLRTSKATKLPFFIGTFFRWTGNILHWFGSLSHILGSSISTLAKWLDPKHFETVSETVKGISSFVKRLFGPESVFVRAFSVIKSAFSGGAAGGSGLSRIIASAGRFLGNIPKFMTMMGKVLWPLQIAMSVYDAISGFMNAGELLGKADKDVTIVDRFKAAGGSLLAGLADFPVQAASWLLRHLLKAIFGEKAGNWTDPKSMGELFGYTNTAQFFADNIMPGAMLANVSKWVYESVKNMFTSILENMEDAVNQFLYDHSMNLLGEDNTAAKREASRKAQQQRADAAKAVESAQQGQKNAQNALERAQTSGDPTQIAAAQKQAEDAAKAAEKAAQEKAEVDKKTAIFEKEMQLKTAKAEEEKLRNLQIEADRIAASIFSTEEEKKKAQKITEDLEEARKKRVALEQELADTANAQIKIDEQQKVDSAKQQKTEALQAAATAAGSPEAIAAAKKLASANEALASARSRLASVEMAQAHLSTKPVTGSDIVGHVTRTEDENERLANEVNGLEAANIKLRKQLENANLSYEESQKIHKQIETNSNARTALQQGRVSGIGPEVQKEYNDLKNDQNNQLTIMEKYKNDWFKYWNSEYQEAYDQNNRDQLRINELLPAINAKMETGGIVNNSSFLLAKDSGVCQIGENGPEGVLPLAINQQGEMGVRLYTQAITNAAGPTPTSANANAVGPRVGKQPPATTNTAAPSVSPPSTVTAPSETAPQKPAMGFGGQYKIDDQGILNTYSGDYIGITDLSGADKQKAWDALQPEITTYSAIRRKMETDPKSVTAQDRELYDKVSKKLLSARVINLKGEMIKSPNTTPEAGKADTKNPVKPPTETPSKDNKSTGAAGAKPSETAPQTNPVAAGGGLTAEEKKEQERLKKEQKELEGLQTGLEGKTGGNWFHPDSEEEKENKKKYDENKKRLEQNKKRLEQLEGLSTTSAADSSDRQNKADRQRYMDLHDKVTRKQQLSPEDQREHDTLRAKFDAMHILRADGTWKGDNRHAEVDRSAIQSFVPNIDRDQLHPGSMFSGMQGVAPAAGTGTAVPPGGNTPGGNVPPTHARGNAFQRMLTSFSGRGRTTTPPAKTPVAASGATSTDQGGTSASSTTNTPSTTNTSMVGLKIPNGIPQTIAAEAAKMGIDPAFACAVAQIESNFNPNCRTGSYSGLFQLSQKDDNYTPTSDVASQARQGIQALLKTKSALKKSLGREPTAGELYMTHQQGIGGGPALIKASQSGHGSDPAYMALMNIKAYSGNQAKAQKAIEGNLPKSMRGKNVTVNDMLNYYYGKINGNMAKYGRAGGGGLLSTNAGTGGGAAGTPPAAAGAGSGAGDGPKTTAAPSAGTDSTTGATPSAPSTAPAPATAMPTAPPTGTTIAADVGGSRSGSGAPGAPPSGVTATVSNPVAPGGTSSVGSGGATGASTVVGSSKGLGQGEPPASVPLTTVKSKSGVKTDVATAYAPKFQGLINDLETGGYKVKELGGYCRRRNVNNPSKWSIHSWGAAMDINATANPNKSTRTDLPANTNQLASKWGLGWGMNFRKTKDPMHFSAAENEGGKDVTLPGGSSTTPPTGADASTGAASSGGAPGAGSGAGDGPKTTAAPSAGGASDSAGGGGGSILPPASTATGGGGGGTAAAGARIGGSIGASIGGAIGGMISTVGSLFGMGGQPSTTGSGPTGVSGATVSNPVSPGGASTSGTGGGASTSNPVASGGASTSGAGGDTSGAGGSASSSLLEHIKKLEGFEPRAKWDYKQWTNGYGTKAKAQGEVIDRKEAEARLQTEVGKAMATVKGKIDPKCPQGVVDALTSMTYNMGPGAMRQLFGEANECAKKGDYTSLAERVKKYDKAGGKVLAGLTARRATEASWIMSANGKGPAGGANPVASGGASTSGAGGDTSGAGASQTAAGGSGGATAPTTNPVASAGAGGAAAPGGGGSGGGGSILPPASTGGAAPTGTTIAADVGGSRSGSSAPGAPPSGVTATVSNPVSPGGASTSGAGGTPSVAGASPGAGTGGAAVPGGGAGAGGKAGAQGYTVEGNADMSGVKPEFLNKFSQAAAEYTQATGKKMRITSAFRSPEKQKQLYDEAVKKYGSEAAARKWVAPPGKSMHNFGLALDVDYKAGTGLSWLESKGILKKYGLVRRLGNEPWHVEPVGAQQMAQSGGGSTGEAASGAASIGAAGPSSDATASATNPVAPSGGGAASSTATGSGGSGGSSAPTAGGGISGGISGTVGGFGTVGIGGSILPPATVGMSGPMSGGIYNPIAGGIGGAIGGGLTGLMTGGLAGAVGGGLMGLAGGGMYPGMARPMKGGAFPGIAAGGSFAAIPSASPAAAPPMMASASAPAAAAAPTASLPSAPSAPASSASSASGGSTTSAGDTSTAAANPANNTGKDSGGNLDLPDIPLWLGEGGLQSMNNVASQA